MNEVPTMPEDHDPPNPRRDAIEAMLAYCDENDLPLPDTIKTQGEPADEHLRLWLSPNSVAEAWIKPAARFVSFVLTDQSIEGFPKPVWFADWVVEIPGAGVELVPVRVQACYFEKPEYLT